MADIQMSDATPPRFINDFHSLPASGISSHSHIIDVDELLECDKFNGPIHLQDVIATILYNISPSTLEQFFSPTTFTFKAVFKGPSSLVIWRKGSEVLVGEFEHLQTFKLYKFHTIAGFRIGYDGSWHIKATLGSAVCDPKWTDVWHGKFGSYNGLEEMNVDLTDEDMADRAFGLAEALVRKRYWEVKHTIQTT